jgi:hypothetical protein
MLSYVARALTRTAVRPPVRALASSAPPGDEESRTKERKIIMSRFSGSKVADALRADRDKKFTATPELLDDEHIFPLPDLEVEHVYESRTTTLRGMTSQQTATLVTVSFNGFGKKQLSGVHDAFTHAYGLTGLPTGRVPHVGLVDLSYVQGWAYSMLRFALLPGLQKSILEPMRPFSFVKFERSEAPTEVSVAHPTPWGQLVARKRALLQMFCFDAKIHNRMISYSYLVDRDGSVRWW